jgi:transcription-repair coupling factor (superfamily II helicase)
LAAAIADSDVDAIGEELKDRFGEIPEEALRLLDVAKLRIKAKEMGIKDLALQGKYLKIAPFKISESAQLRIQRLYPGSIVKSVTNTLLIARPTVAAWSQESQKIGDTSLLNWVNETLAELNSPIKQREGN